MKKKQMSAPEPRHGAELILKSNCEYSSRFTSQLAPGIFILGNREGLRWLSDYLGWIATGIRDDQSFNESDPDNHTHLDYLPPVNQRLSDELGIMVGSFTSKHRRRILKNCGVSKARRVTGNPIRHLLAHLEFIESIGKLDIDSMTENLVQDLERLNMKVKEIVIRLKKAVAQSQSKQIP